MDNPNIQEKRCKPTRYSKVNCNCSRCKFVIRFNKTKPEDCKCVRCEKFHLDWLNTPVCENCRKEKTNAYLENGAVTEGVKS